MIKHVERCFTKKAMKEYTVKQDVRKKKKLSQKKKNKKETQEVNSNIR